MKMLRGYLVRPENNTEIPPHPLKTKVYCVYFLYQKNELSLSRQYSLPRRILCTEHSGGELEEAVLFKTIIKKTLMLLETLILITFLSFCLSYLSPSDPAEIKFSKMGIAPTNEMLETMRAEMGLDKPMLVQYGTWLKGMLSGDMGTSYKSNRPVMDDLLKALPNTISLTLISMLLMIIISIPAGVLCAKHKDGIFDNIMRFVTYLFASLPSFVLALLFLLLFCVHLGWFGISPEKNLKGLFMPAMVLSLSLSAWYIRQVRSIILEELSKEYVIGSRARGVKESSILFRHVLKNSLLPIVTLIGNSFAMLLGGATIVENIFSWPGLGRLAVEAIAVRDYPVIQAYVVWMSIIFMLVNYLVDLSYQWIDPRIRTHNEELANG